MELKDVKRAIRMRQAVSYKNHVYKVNACRLHRSRWKDEKLQYSIRLYCISESECKFYHTHDEWNKLLTKYSEFQNKR